MCTCGEHKFPGLHCISSFFFPSIWEIISFSMTSSQIEFFEKTLLSKQFECSNTNCTVWKHTSDFGEKKTNARIQLNRTFEAMVVCVKYQLIVIGRMIYRANKMPSGFWFIFNEEIIMTRSLLDCFSSDPSQRKRIFCSVKISK